MTTESETLRHQRKDSKSRMRVLRISHSATVDAYRERDRQLSKLDNMDIELVTPEFWDHLGGKNEAISEPFPVHRATTYGTGSVPLFAFDPAVVRKALISFKPDLVDVHEEPYSVSGFECVFLARRYAPSAACVFYSAQNILKRYPPPFCWTEQYVFDRSTGAYPCSEGVKTVLKTKGFSTNCDVIPLGVDLALYTPDGPQKRSNFALTTDNFVIGFFGRVESYKGAQFLLQAMAGAAHSSNWRLLVVGSGSYEAELKMLAANLGVSDRVVWAGSVAGEDVPSYMRSCDLIAVPSLTTKTWREQFGRIVVESMACGVPVVAFDSGSLPEVVGETGLLATEGSVSAIGEAINRLAVNAELRQSLSERGLHRARVEYSWQKVAELTSEMYDRAIALHKGK